MRNLMVEYKTEHSFGAAATMEGFPEFAAIYDRLRTSEILEYEEKSRISKNSGGGRIQRTVPSKASGKYETGAERIQRTE